jgi:hypothetical protein
VTVDDSKVRWVGDRREGAKRSTMANMNPCHPITIRDPADLKTVSISHDTLKYLLSGREMD